MDNNGPGVTQLTPQQVAAIEAQQNGVFKLTPWQEAGLPYSTWFQQQQQAISQQSALTAAQIANQNRLAGGGSSDNGPAWANVGLGRDQLAEQRRQYDETMGADKSKFNQQMALDQATQKWKEATDSRDYQAAEYWRARTQELQQNQLALNYTQMLANKQGPQDWVSYWYLSRGMTPPAGSQSIPIDQALPAWARGATPGTYPNSSGQAPGAFGFTAAPGAAPAPGGPPGAGAPGAGSPGAGAPAWADVPQPNMDIIRKQVADATAAGQPLTMGQKFYMAGGKNTPQNTAAPSWA